MFVKNVTVHKNRNRLIISIVMCVKIYPLTICFYVCMSAGSATVINKHQLIAKKPFQKMLAPISMQKKLNNIKLQLQIF